MDYKGHTVCEMPPNGHGITALMALQILEGFAPGAAAIYEARVLQNARKERMH